MAKDMGESCNDFGESFRKVHFCKMLIRAAKNGYLLMVKSAYASSNAEWLFSNVARETSPLNSPHNEPSDILEHRLLCEASASQLETTRWLLAKEVDIEKPGFGVTRVTTPLYHSARQNKPKIAQLLIDRGADLNTATTPPGLTALYGAIDGGRSNRRVLKLVRLLLENGAVSGIRTSTWERDLPLHCAVRRGLESVIEVLLAHNAAIEDTGPSRVFFKPDRAASWRPDDQEYTPLMVAAEHGQYRAVRTLLENGANVHARLPKSGFDALCLALVHGVFRYQLDTGLERLIQILLDYGADIDRNRRGRPPLIEALRSLDTIPGCKYRHIQVLVDRGADINKVSEMGESALRVVCQSQVHSDEKLAILKIQNFAEPLTPTLNGWPAH